MDNRLDQKTLQEIEDYYNGLVFLAEDNNPRTILFATAKFIIKYFRAIDNEEVRMQATASMMTKIGLPLCCDLNPETLNHHNEFQNDMMFILKKYQHKISQGSNKK